MEDFIVAGMVKVGERTEHNIVMRKSDFRRYVIRTLRRHRTIKRKMERETKKLNCELWEVFGI